MAQPIGMDKVKRKFDALAKNVNAEASMAVEKSCVDLVKWMRAFAPDDPKTVGKDLRESIRWHWADRDVNVGGRMVRYVTRALVRAGGTEGTMRELRSGSGIMIDNARIQEFGAKGTPPSPYFFTTWRANKSVVRGRLTRAVRKAIRNANKA